MRSVSVQEDVAISLKGAPQLIKKLKRMADRIEGAKRIRGAVTFTAPYALKVHEDLKVHHPRGKAKFLEEPINNGISDGSLNKVFMDAINSGKTAQQAVLMVCLYIQRQAQLIVPVDTGFLRASAQSSVESNG